MKRMMLCIWCCILMLWSGAVAESCQHENLLMCSLKGKWVDLGVGHQYVYTKSCVCDDCSQSIISKIYCYILECIRCISSSISITKYNTCSRYILVVF